MWFNKKLTAFAQSFAQLEARVNKIERDFEGEKSSIRRNLLEFAELGEKMRRTYLRLSRIVKIDSQAASAVQDEQIEENGQNTTSPRDIRDAIDAKMGL